MKPLYICKIHTGGGGIGNKLFPWARACIYSYIHKLPVIFPVWSQIKIGPILRSQKDKRWYLDLFCTNNDYINGFQSLWFDLTLNNVPEPALLTTSPDKLCDRSCKVVFEGLKDYFESLNGWKDLIYQKIRSITKKKWLISADNFPEISIAMHIRRGDYTAENWVPNSWYRFYLRHIRELVGENIVAYLFSDGNYAQLKDILINEPNVKFINNGNALRDLLLLSKAKVLLSSPSTFSAWASYLGEMPTLSFPGHYMSWYGLKSSENQFREVCQQDNPPEQFKRHILKCFAK